MVALIGDGNEPSADDVEELLDRASKTPSDLANAVANYQQRKALKAQADRGPELEAEWVKLGKQIENEKAKLQKMIEDQNLVILQLIARQAEAHQEMTAAADAHKKLVDHCPRTDLVSELSTLQSKLWCLNHEANRKHAEASRMAGVAQANERNYRHSVAEQQRGLVSDLNDHADGLTREAAECEQQIRDLESRLMHP